MAERPQKSKRPAKVPLVAPGRNSAGGAGLSPEDRIAALEAERDRLVAELDVARARIAVLEEARLQALNRIDWVIDFLHNLQED